ncbi:MAG: hypothetical protein EVB11_07885 [Winogradskyella sp.]|nr:MAG: hypothetical protein EVB11_07885 [Winogradskyella sp.]
MLKENSELKFTLIFFSVALVICFGLNLDILKDYAFLDAYEFIYTANRNSDFQNIFIENGRPLLGLWSEFFYGSVFETISQLKWARIFALFFCVLFSTQLFRFLLKLGLKPYESAIFSVLVLALPTFTVYFAWSATAQIPILLIANFYAGQLLLKAFIQKKIFSLNFAIAFCIVFISLFMYQSAVMIFILPLIFTVIKTNSFDLKTVTYFILFTLLSFILYFVFFKLTLSISSLDASYRTSLNPLNIPKRVIKFYMFELRILIKNSGFLLISKLSLLIGAIAFLGFLIQQFLIKRSLIFLSALVLILPFCYAPNILSGQSYFSLRAISPTAIIILFYQFWFLRNLCLKYNKTKVGLLIIPVSLLLLSAFNQKKYVAGLQHKEYEILRKAFQDFDINQVNKLVIIRPNYGFLQELGYLKNGFSGEFGNLSSVKDWVPNHLFSQIKWEQQKDRNKTSEVFPIRNINIYNQDNYIQRHNIKTIHLVELFEEAFTIKSF